MGKKKTNEEWWLEKLKMLLDNVHGLDKVNPQNINDIQFWALIKLIILGYFIPFHTTIINSENNLFEKCIYIDLFSGSGLNQIKDKPDLPKFTGSPLVSVNASNQNYHEMIFVEDYKKFRDALEQRLNQLEKMKDYKWLAGKYDVFDPMDANKAVPIIIDRIHQSDELTHTLFFIDPYGMQLDFSSFEKILKETNSDIIFYFNSERYMQQVEAGKRGNSPQKNDRFFGGSYWRTVKNAENLYKHYIKLVKKFRSEVVTFPIMKNSRIEKYKLVVCTKKTQGGNPWLKNFKKELKKRLDRKTGEWVEGFSNKEIFKTQTGLDDFF